MEITGRLIRILPENRGESARGPWVRGGFVIETEGEYPRQVAFDLFGEDRLAMVKALALNSPVVVNFNPESREFNDKWYTNLRCTRVQNYVPGQMAPQAGGYGAWQGAPAQNPAAPAQAPASTQPAAPFASAPATPNPDDDLPF